MLGLVLAGAVGRPVAEYLEQKIWPPMGAEADATAECSCSGACGGSASIVDPRSKIVMVNTAVHRLPVDPGPLRGMGAFDLALVRQLGGAAIGGSQ